MSQEQLAAGHVGVFWRPFRVTSVGTVVCTSATLHHFDTKVGPKVKIGPLIPWERRLARMEISVFQEVTYGPVFGNRDYGRPFRRKLVTLRRFD